MTNDAQVMLDQMEIDGYPTGTTWVRALQFTAAADEDAAAAADAASAADAATKHTPKQAALIHKFLTEEQPMREGLVMVQVPGRYGYGVTLIGFARHVRGFEYEMGAGHVSVVRTSGRRTLGELASEGPREDHSLTVSKTAEDLHEFRVRRVRAVDLKAWAKHVKKPNGWE